jgi:hypothetical protein
MDTDLFYRRERWERSEVSSFLDADFAGYAEKYSHKEAQKAQRKINHE